MMLISWVLRDCGVSGSSAVCQSITDKRIKKMELFEKDVQGGVLVFLKYLSWRSVDAECMWYWFRTIAPSHDCGYHRIMVHRKNVGKYKRKRYDGLAIRKVQGENLIAWNSPSWPRQLDISLLVNKSDSLKKKTWQCLTHIKTRIKDIYTLVSYCSWDNNVKHLYL